MKKAMLCMIFSLLLLFSACSNEIKDAKNDANTVLNTGNTIETSNEYEVEYPLLSIDSLPEYNKFLTEKANNQKLLSYSTLQNIGEFEGITFLSNAKAGDYSNYMYELCDASGYTLYLYVKVGNSEDEGKVVSEEQVDLHNLRKLHDNSSGTYVCEDYEYRYVSGELLSIQWENEAYSFVLSGEAMLSDYPETTNTILGSLLSADTSYASTNILHGLLPN